MFSAKKSTTSGNYNKFTKSNQKKNFLDLLEY